MTGKIGLRHVDAGNIVHAADANGLAVITQLQPISVIFSVAQDDVPPIIEKMNAGEKLEVDVYDRGLTKKLAVGKLEAAESSIDQSTSSLQFKAIFPNEDNALYPNQFVNVRLLIDTKRDVVIVPSAAVQMSPDSTFVYVVEKEAPAQRRRKGYEQVAARKRRVMGMQKAPVEKMRVCRTPLAPQCRRLAGGRWIRSPSANRKGMKSSSPAAWTRGTLW